MQSSLGLQVYSIGHNRPGVSGWAGSTLRKIRIFYGKNQETHQQKTVQYSAEFPDVYVRNEILQEILPYIYCTLYITSTVNLTLFSVVA